ncbi:hypothetical protein ZIOFF_070162 [Zingiber officinale]|uniref:S1 motif domain-containing protein n=1 Tax=Zingiber officinale TaxID=94328 RepID=A0A8J5EQG4_ZINOF|nr:hypothetical protein ZIOFF_070162 [Zingiber officinale]
MARLGIGDVVKCHIKKITHFGIFVVVEGVPALVHQSEISWDTTLDPSSCYKVGQMVEAKVHQLDCTLEQIFLSLRDRIPDLLIEALESVIGDDKNDFEDFCSHSTQLADKSSGVSLFPVIIVNGTSEDDVANNSRGDSVKFETEEEEEMEIERPSFIKNRVVRLPPGFRFHATDEELVAQYLKRKAFSWPLPVAVIPEINLSEFEPWDLPDESAIQKIDPTSLDSHPDIPLELT